MSSPMHYSTTAERTYRDCQRQWYWRHREGWRLITPPEALEFGSAWHRLREGLGAPMVDHYRAAHLAALDACYREHWAPMPLDVIATEQQFECELIPGVPLVGVIDKLVRHGDGVWICEHKTTGSDIAPESDYWPKLGMDAQLSTYWLGARALGLRIDGVIYDVARKCDLRPALATPIETRKYRKDGQLYANQRDTDETPAEFGARCSESIRADPTRHFARREVARTESQLAEHWLHMQTYARQMQAIAAECDAPRNPDACARYGRCEFYGCCLGGTHPRDHQELHQPQDRHHDNSIPF